MSDALPLPPRPSLEHYRKRAKDLVRLCRAGDAEAFRAWVAAWIDALVKLHDLDLALPREGGRAYTPAEIASRVERTAGQLATHLNASDQSSAADCTLARAQLAIARTHGFESWPKFAKHLEGLARDHSPVSQFEAAVDAIVSGDVASLAMLLNENPELVRARSTREHRSTLLHYVSANGVEDYRQRTPKNIVQVTELLLKSGAEVNAESDAYGGRSTTLGLTATSCHPENAGVQIPLMALLIDHGAALDGSDGGSVVNACLHNGRGAAAEFFADRGARLDLEGAAGVGRLDVVKSFFGDDDTLRPPATRQQMHAGFAWACEFGRTAVVEFLLQRGMDPAARLTPYGQETGLHWAAYIGHAAIARLLLDRGAPVGVKDARHDGTPLDWALHGWRNPPPGANRTAYYEVVALLARAGAAFDPRYRAADKIQSDPLMLAALRGEMPHSQ